MSLHEVVDLSSLLTSENQQQSQKESLLAEIETAISKQEIRMVAEKDANERLLKTEYHAVKTDSEFSGHEVDGISLCMSQVTFELENNGRNRLEALASTIEEYESTRDALHADIDFIEKEADGLEQVMQSLSSPRINQVKEEVPLLEQQTASKKKELADRQNVVWRNQEMLQQENVLLGELRKRESEAKEEQQRINGEQAKIAIALDTRREADKASNWTHEEDSAAMRDEARKLREAVAELNAKLEALRADEDKKQADIVDLKQSIEDLKIQNGNLETDLNVTLLPNLEGLQRRGEEEAEALIRETDSHRAQEQALAGSHQKFLALEREVKSAATGKDSFAEAGAKIHAVVEQIRTDLGRIEEQKLKMESAMAAQPTPLADAAQPTPLADAADALTVVRRLILELDEQRLSLERQTAMGGQKLTELEQQLQGADPAPIRSELEAQERAVLLLQRRLSAEDHAQDGEEELECSQPGGSGAEEMLRATEEEEGEELRVDASLQSGQRAAEERLEKERAWLDGSKEDLARLRKHRTDMLMEEQESAALVQHREQLVHALKASLARLMQELRDEDEKFKVAVLAAQEGHSRIERELQRELASLVKMNVEVQRSAAAELAAAASGEGSYETETKGAAVLPRRYQNRRSLDAPAPAASKPRPTALFDLIAGIDIDAGDFASSDEEKAHQSRGAGGNLGSSRNWSSSDSEDGNDAMETSRTSTGSGWLSNVSRDSHETADTDTDLEALLVAPSPPAVMQVHRKDSMQAAPAMSPRGGVTGHGTAGQATGQTRKKGPTAAASSTSSTSSASSASISTRILGPPANKMASSASSSTRVSGPPASQTASKPSALTAVKKKPSTTSSLSWDDSPAGKSLFGRYESSSFSSTSFSSSSAPRPPVIARRATLEGENAPNVRGAAPRPHVQFQEPPKRSKSLPAAKKT